MRKLLLPETGKIMQQNVPSHLPEHLAVTQPGNTQAVEQDLFLEESLSSTAYKRCLGSKTVLLRGPPAFTPAVPVALPYHRACVSPLQLLGAWVMMGEGCFGTSSGQKIPSLGTKLGMT